MTDNKCGCDGINLKKDINENDGCGCEKDYPEPIKEDTNCGCSSNNPEPIKEDTNCGCSSNNPESADDGGCCGSVVFPDISIINNPDTPKFLIDESFIQEFEDYAHSLGISSIGYTLMTPELLIRDKFIQYPHTIVLTMELDEKIIATAPGEEAKGLNDLFYKNFGEITYKLSDYLRENGYATEVAHPFDGIVNYSLLAQNAGLGYIGQSKLLITPEIGPKLKISAIFISAANLPIKEGNEHSWIVEYCNRCGKCVKACPEKALIEKESCCGSQIELVKENCIGCSEGCTYCIKDCPFETKGYEHIKTKFDKLNAKLKAKSESRKN